MLKKFQRNGKEYEKKRIVLDCDGRPNTKVTYSGPISGLSDRLVYEAPAKVSANIQAVPASEVLPSDWATAIIDIYYHPINWTNSSDVTFKFEGNQDQDVTSPEDCWYPNVFDLTEYREGKEDVLYASITKPKEGVSYLTYYDYLSDEYEESENRKPKDCYSVISITLTEIEENTFISIVDGVEVEKWTLYIKGDKLIVETDDYFDSDNDQNIVEIVKHVFNKKNGLKAYELNDCDSFVSDIDPALFGIYEYKDSSGVTSSLISIADDSVIKYYYPMHDNVQLSEQCYVGGFFGRVRNISDNLYGYELGNEIQEGYSLVLEGEKITVTSDVGTLIYLKSELKSSDLRACVSSSSEETINTDLSPSLDDLGSNGQDNIPDDLDPTASENTSNDSETSIPNTDASQSTQLTIFGTSDIHINSTTNNIQKEPKIASDRNGDYMVIWLSYKQINNISEFNLYGKIFDKKNLPLSSEFRINDTVNPFSTPYYDICSSGEGKFSIVWSEKEKGESPIVYVKQFSISGSQISSLIIVDDESDNWVNQEVAIDYQYGKTVVAYGWARGFSEGIRFKVYSELSDIVDRHKVVNHSYAELSGVKISNLKTIAVSWNIDNFYPSVWAAVFNTGGIGIKEAWEVSPDDGVEHNDSSLDMDPNGIFSIAWSAEDRVKGSVFDKDGKLITELSDMVTKDSNSMPVVAIMYEKVFVSYTDSEILDGGLFTSEDVFLEEFLSNTGEKVFSQRLQLNNFSSNKQSRQDISINEKGQFNAVWQDAFQEVDLGDDVNLKEGIFGTSGNSSVGGFTVVPTN